MSLITLQLGQCGNQLGLDLHNLLASEAPEGSRNSDVFFRRGSADQRVARTLLLDMEPKVVQACMRKARLAKSNWCYDSRNAILQQSGSGNNWALGYHQHGARCAEAAVERARREVERCDQFGGFVLLQSLAGGTGAGFGSRIAHELCDHMPSAPRLSCAVWPYETGEVIVQAYNALLSVEMLYSVCDGVLLLQNEELHATCAVRCARRSGKSACGQAVHNNTRPNFKDLNAVAAHALASLLLPCRLRDVTPTDPSAVTDTTCTGSPSAQDPRSPPRASGSSTGRRSGGPRLSAGVRAAQSNTAAALSHIPADLKRGLTLADLLTQTAGHPAYKLLTLRTVPQIEQSAVKYTTFAWSALLKRLMQMFVTGTTCPDRLDWSVATGADVTQGYRGAYNKSAGSVLVARGLLAPQVDAAAVAAAQFYPPWQTTPLLVAASARPFQGYEMCGTMLSSDRALSITHPLLRRVAVDAVQACLRPLHTAIRKARAMLHARAYVHQYEQHGMPVSALDGAMGSAKEIASAYASM